MITRKGFTLVELLVVIAIIGVLIALLLPAVQAAREAARRAQCLNNLKQVGLAAHNYDSAQGKFPPGSVMNGVDTEDTNVFTNWAVEMLPYVELQTLYDQYDQSLHNTHPDNLPVLQTSVKAYLCPSDTNPPALAQPFGFTELMAPGSYKNVIGTAVERDAGASFWWDRSYSPSEVVANYWARGAMHAQGFSSVSGETFRNMTDGSSKTLLVGEYHTFSTPARRPFWGNSYRPVNSAATQESSELRLADFDRCVDISGSYARCRRAFGSLHAGGIMNFAYCDGSVSSVLADIDGSIYAGLGTIAGDDQFGVPGAPQPPQTPR